ncbi:MAG: PP2C family protein-serine/threonine phosphatase [Gemmataceae bacterium]
MIGFDSLQHGTLTDVGIRRSHNQDALATILAKSPEGFRQQGHIFLVADGMGGHAVGEKASAKAVRDIPLTYLKHARDGVANALRRAFVETNAGIYAIGQKNPEFKGLGTTATALVLRPEGAWFAHVGDSRGYRVRDGQIQQLTFDHSYVWEMARRQNCAPEEIQGFRSNVIIRSLGPDALVQVDVEGPHLLQPGDVFVLCSDGLSGPISDPEIGAVASMLPPEEACQFLVQLANLRGGPDNVSALIVRVGDPKEAGQPKATRSLWSRLTRIHWSLPLLACGVGLTVVALLMSLAAHWAGVLLFIAAAATIGAGFVGLLLHARAEKRRQAEEPPPPNINVYREAPCSIDAAVVDKLAKANANLRERIAEVSADLVPTTFQPHIDRGDALAKGEDYAEAFREHCRAMHELAKSYNKTRNKPEVFQPIWDRPK